MRKIILLCVLAIGMMADAQTVQTIAKPLKLNIVAQGTAADSVLVRGADKIVKFIPRSEFAGGSPPTLQQVLDNNISPFVESKNTFSLTYRESFGYSNLTLDSAVASLKNTTNLFGNYYGEFSIPNGKPMMILKKDNNKTINLQLSDPLYYQTDVYVPCPPESATGNTLALSVNGNYADASGNITVSSINITFTTNDGKTVTVTNGVITNVQ